MNEICRFHDNMLNRSKPKQQKTTQIHILILWQKNGIDRLCAFSVIFFHIFYRSQQRVQSDSKADAQLHRWIFQKLKFFIFPLFTTSVTLKLILELTKRMGFQRRWVFFREWLCVKQWSSTSKSPFMGYIFAKID